MADLNQIAEDLSSLTIMEAAELATLLEEKWGVSAAAPVAMAAAPGAGEAFFDLYGWFWREGRLDQELKEVVRLRNARLTDCGY